MLGIITRSTGLFVLALLLLNGSCGGPSGDVIVGTARAPGADGLIDAEEEGSRGALVNVHMERLPAPEQLGEGFKYYVVWYESNGGKPIRAGSLTYQREARTGDLVNTCPYRKFRVRITAERSREANTPSELTIAERAVLVD